MNWLQKIANEEDAAYEESLRYFGIGHGDFNEELGYNPKYIVWSFINGDVQAGPVSEQFDEDTGEFAEGGGTHGSLWGHHITDKGYKGRYEPETGVVAIVKPKGKELYPVPQIVLDRLKERFSHITKIVEF